jgi:hypothetical protein
MFKKIAMLAAGLMLSVSAFAADTIRGINQNGAQETVGTKPIFAVKSVNGVLSYRSALGGGTTYTLTDSNGSQFNKVLTSFGAGNAIQVMNGPYAGWYYDLGKIAVKCYNPQNSSVSIDGVSLADFLGDSCTFATQANGQ